METRRFILSLAAASLSVVFASCAGRRWAEAPDARGRLLGRPVAVSLAELDGEPPEEEPEPPEPPVVTVSLPAGLGVRGGLATYPATEDYDLDPRLSLGVYYHFAEKETQRLEAGADLLMDGEDAGENRYWAAHVDYVKYVGKTQAMHWSAGGGLFLEKLYDRSYTTVYIQGGVGYTLGQAEKTLDLRAGLQLPVGKDLNALLVLTVGAGYDF
jgi:hypothetical protein